MYNDSIYYFKNIGEFKRYIHTIDDQSLSVSEALGTFREVVSLPKKFHEMTVQQLSDDPKMIGELAESLRHGMKPEYRFKLSYKIQDREKELIDSLSENFAIDRSKAKVKIVISHYRDMNTGFQEFNYCLEVAMAPRTDIGVGSAGTVIIIGNINSTPGIDGGHRYFESASGTSEYVWKDKRGNTQSASSLIHILANCGFSTYLNISKKRVPCVLYINLLTACPDWLGSAGKTHINLTPYAITIAKTVSSLAYKMPSYYGQGYGSPSRSIFTNEEDVAADYLRDFLKKRYAAVQADPTLKNRDRLTQSGVWYRIRPVMIENGFEPRIDWGKTRRTLQGSIKQRCAELSQEVWHEKVTREDLGIIAKARAMMLYGGDVYPVSIDNIRELARKGVAIVVIEKEGIAEILKDSAEKHGVALVHTQGRFTDYTKDLIEAAKLISPHVVTLTDYDAVGVQTSAATRTQTERIGVDMETITWLQQNGYPNLTVEDVQEEYRPNLYIDDEYLQHHRIELDSISAIVSAEGFWKYVVNKLEQLAHKPGTKGFDYITNEVITRPDSKELYPNAITELLSKLREYAEEITEDEWYKITEELSDVKELLQVKDMENENKEKLKNAVTEDAVIQEIVIPKIAKLLKELTDKI